MGGTAPAGSSFLASLGKMGAVLERFSAHRNSGNKNALEKTGVRFYHLSEADVPPAGGWLPSEARSNQIKKAPVGCLFLFGCGGWT